MQSLTIKVRKTDVAAVVAAAHPEYRGRRFRVRVAETLTLDDVHWSGGTRNEYVAVQLGTGAARPAAVPAPWFLPSTGLRVTLPVGWVVVERSHYCGQDLGITVHADPRNVGRMLPPARLRELGQCPGLADGAPCATDCAAVQP